MFLLPGCSCCGCRPCASCSPPCLKLTFSGFGYEGEACSECSTLDGQEIILRRPVAFGWVYPTATDADGPDEGEAANGSGATFQTIGINNIGGMINLARREDGSYYVTGVPIGNGGSGYDSPVLSFTSTGLIQCREPTVEVAVTGGAITAVTVTEGGEYWPFDSCTYTGRVCPTCFPPAPGALATKYELHASFSVGASSNSITVFRRQFFDYGGGFGSPTSTTIVTATQPSIDENGDPISCDGFVFEAENVAGCQTNGTITVEAVDCETPQADYCDATMPDQITLTLSGMGDGAVWYSTQRNLGHLPFGSFEDWPCDVSQEGIVAFQSGPGSVPGAGSRSGTLGQADTSIVLDLAEGSDCGSWYYEGRLPTRPTAGQAAGGDIVFDCGGDIEGATVGVTIAPVGLETTVTVSPPTKGPTNVTATAEVTGIGAGGAITGIGVTLGGSGYAIEIIHHDEPTLTAAVNSATGTGAELTVVLSVVGTDPRTRHWIVDSVTVDEPGTGYANGDTVVITAAEGDTVAEEAYATVVTQFSEPTITAVPPATDGTAATLAVVLQPSYGEWRVQSVTVTSGGTGYVEGDAVTFTAAEGDTVSYAAEAILHVVKTIPTITASGGSGTGVTFTVNLATNGDYWRVDTITASGGGTGYVDGEYLTIEGAAGDVEVGAASARVRTVRGEPVIDAEVVGSSGTGAVLAVSLTASGGYWYYSSMSITDGGSGYAVDDEIVLVLTDATEYGYGYGSASVSAVDGTGAITAVSASFGRTFFRDTGVIDSVQVMSYGDYYHTDGVIASVEVQSGGSYYRDDGIIESVSVLFGGEYYVLNPTGTVDADEPLVFFRSRIGRGATATAVVDEDLESETFGQITAIAIDAGGEDYRSDGYGWLTTIAVSGGDAFSHRDYKLGDEPIPVPEVPPPGFTDTRSAYHCAEFFDDFGPLANRVSTQVCPSDLLGREYSMVVGVYHTFGYSGLTIEDIAGPGIEDAMYCQVPIWAYTFFGPLLAGTNYTFFEFSDGPIKMTLAPA